ncbi:MAG: hypothetical protein IJN43_00050 [Ruminococcus sp.]|nr:hypothetical protein [Ruminococcus sp.]
MIGRLKKAFSVVVATLFTVCIYGNNFKTISDEVKEFNAKAVDTTYGDITNDGVVDVMDLCLLKQYLFENKDNLTIDTMQGDLNSDGIIDVGDAQELQQFLLCQRDTFTVNTRKNIENKDTSIVSQNQPIETAVTSEMAEKADELGNALSIYNYLYNNMRSEFYYGSRKGAIGAYEQGGGNDTDLSSLLIAMLRYRGYDANYVTANVGFTEEQLLKWTNVDSIDVAQSIYAINGRKHDSNIIDDVTYYFCDYKYVQVIIDDKTYYLDICFKEYENQNTVYDAIDSEYTLDNAKNIIDNMDLSALDIEINKAESVEDILSNQSFAYNSQKIVTRNETTLPIKTSYIVNSELIVSEEVTEEESDLISIGIEDSLDTFRSAELYRKNITVSYEVSDETADFMGEYFESTNNIFALPHGYGLSVTPIIKIEGKDEIRGRNLKLWDSQKLNIVLKTGNMLREYSEELTAGEMCSIVLDTGQISPHELGAAYSKLLNNTEFLNKNNGFTKELSTKEIDEKINGSNVYNDDYLGNLLRFTGIMYFSQFDIMVNALAERNNIHYDNASRIIVVGFKPNLYDANPGQNLISKEGYFYIDVLSNISKNISKTNDEKSLEAFRFTRGLFSSELESSVLNQILGVECFSTTTILRYANERNIPLVKLSADSKTKVDDLSINESDKVEIQNAIDAGNTVIVPTSNMKIGSWNGVGYIITSSDNSVQYYKISGQYNGGSTSIPVALASIVNIAIDALWLAEGVTAMIAILTGMTALSFFPVVGLMIAAISIELLVIDIMSTVLDNYDYYINSDDEAGENIRLSATINVLTFGVFKGASAVSKGIKYAGVAQKYGKATVSNLKSAGFTTSQITSKVNQFKNLGISTTTIDTLLKNPKCMFLGDDILTFLGKQGGNQGLLAELVISNGDDFTKALINTKKLNEFCNLAWKYGDDVAKVLTCGDDAISFISKYEDASDIIKCFKTGDVKGIEKLFDAKNSTVFTFSTTNSGKTFVAGSGNYVKNPTITVPNGYFDDIASYQGNNYYYEKYNNLLNKKFIKDSVDISPSVKNELYKLSDAIAYTKSEAYNAGKLYTYGNISEPSFTASHSVTNCGEIWSAREAILNGAKFEELTFQSIYSSNGEKLAMCENCHHTFVEYLKLLKGE